MRSTSVPGGIAALGLLLLWNTVTLARSSASAKAAPVSSAKQPAESSTAIIPLICNASGEICVPIGTQRARAAEAAASVPPTKSPHAGTSKPVSAPSSSATAAPELPRSKQPTIAGSRPLICDATGKVCASASAQAAADSVGSQSRASKGEPANRGDLKFIPTTATLVQPSQKTDRGRSQVNGPGSPEGAPQIRIDGSDVYDGLATDDPFNWAVHAYKSQHRLEVYFKGHLYKTYHAVFGRSLTAGAKLWEGDRRTPEGNYLIVGKHRSSRFGWFLHINYPNELDQQRFEQSRAAHLIPTSAQEGGQIGIHGTDSPYLNVADVNWTTGCISVDNTDIRELARLLPVGTLVIINP